MNIQHVIDLLNRAELYEESTAVLEMVEQNKDMLDALRKSMSVIDEALQDGYLPSGVEYTLDIHSRYLKDAIIRDEATE